ncbi:histidine kinase 5 [Dorcoceras hygrometricum]|uniref:Histidine kinase 5 n=1 Tax=Dorcoceras hygrometricum TaxID=472368 RepID=A0A2Z7CGL9_9LAMI|nr:histidine kinase 5 [Dorcoceras hygrometricum]
MYCFSRDRVLIHASFNTCYCWGTVADPDPVSRIGYPRMSASSESSTTMHRFLHASGSHPIQPPNDPNPSQLGGRHSHPVVTAPTIALDFSDTTQQSASHNVAPNQILLAQITQQELPGSSNPKAHASSRTLAQAYLKSFELQ